MCGAVEYGSRIVDTFDDIKSVFVDWLSIFVHECQADMPLAKICGCVALVAKHSRQGES